jgi:hypothetical protein
MEPKNIIEDTDGIERKMYQYSFQVKKCFSFFWITRMEGTTPSMMPSARNALNWEEHCVLKRLIAVGGARPDSLDIDMTNEPQAKRPKVLKRARTKATISAAQQEAATSKSSTSTW